MDQFLVPFTVQPEHRDDNEVYADVDVHAAGPFFAEAAATHTN